MTGGGVASKRIVRGSLLSALTKRPVLKNKTGLFVATEKLWGVLIVESEGYIR